MRKARRKEGKVEKKKEKSKDEQTVTSIRANLKAGKSVGEIVKGHSNRIYVLDFEGNILASSVEQLRDEITFLLGAALPSDEVVVRLSSPGGAVAQYGLASSQLARLRQAGLRCNFRRASFFLSLYWGLIWIFCGFVIVTASIHC